MNVWAARADLSYDGRTRDHCGKMTMNKALLFGASALGASALMVAVAKSFAADGSWKREDIGGRLETIAGREYFLRVDLSADTESILSAVNSADAVSKLGLLPQGMQLIASYVAPSALPDDAPVSRSTVNHPVYVHANATAKGALTTGTIIDVGNKVGAVISQVFSRESR